MKYKNKKTISKIKSKIASKNPDRIYCILNKRKLKAKSKWKINIFYDRAISIIIINYIIFINLET